LETRFFRTERDGSSLKNHLLIAFNCISISNYHQNAAETFENDNASRGKNIPHIYTRFKNAHKNLFLCKAKNNRYFQIRILRSVFLLINYECINTGWSFEFQLRGLLPSRLV
jgi:hypothetical protein